tara:strand:- start:1028 stop:1537 length:510 start_codon:yes stop_codon:yes gene_type:complete
MMIHVILSAVIGAIAWRGRGGPFGLPGTIITRVLCVLIITLAARFAAGPLGWLMALHMLFIWVGWADWQRMERPSDVLMMSLRGLLQTAPTAAAVWYFGPHAAAYAYLTVGALMGPIYFAANRLYHSNEPRIVIGGKAWVDGPCSIAELVFGFVITSGFVLSFQIDRLL